MALPYFLSARAYVYEHLISRALTSFFFFLIIFFIFFSPPPSFPSGPPPCPPSWFLLALAAGPDPGCSGWLSRPRADRNLQALRGEMLTLAGSRDGVGRGSLGKGRCDSPAASTAKFME